jgi:hypothetical protein
MQTCIDAHMREMSNVHTLFLSLSLCLSLSLSPSLSLRRSLSLIRDSLVDDVIQAIERNGEHRVRMRRACGTTFEQEESGTRCPTPSLCHAAIDAYIVSIFGRDVR